MGEIGRVTSSYYYLHALSDFHMRPSAVAPTDFALQPNMPATSTAFCNDEPFLRRMDLLPPLVHDHDNGMIDGSSNMSCTLVCRSVTQWDWEKAVTSL